jgi:alpha-ketoglutarate-dependent taurine dioxygenase
MWDNRCTVHYAVHDYGEAPRVMHRVVPASLRDISAVMRYPSFRSTL